MSFSNRYSKYRAVRTEVDGIKFASKAEAALYLYLKNLYPRNQIDCQPKIYLTEAKILYKPDFLIAGRYYEMKGVETPSWRIKRRLWQVYGPATLHVYKMRGAKVELTEMISPEPCGESYMP